MLSTQQKIATLKELLAESEDYDPAWLDGWLTDAARAEILADELGIEWKEYEGYFPDAPVRAFGEFDELELLGGMPEYVETLKQYQRGYVYHPEDFGEDGEPLESSVKKLSEKERKRRALAFAHELISRKDASVPNINNFF